MNSPTGSSSRKRGPKFYNYENTVVGSEILSYENNNDYSFKEYNLGPRFREDDRELRFSVLVGDK